MERDSLSPFAGESREWDGTDFKVLMVYEDLRTGLRGIGSINTLHAQMPPGVNFSTSLWQCHLLGDPIFREKAAVEACAADLIILSAHGSGALPEEFHRWIERWLDLRHPRNCAMCVLVDELGSFERKNYSELTYFQNLAKEAGADLFTSIQAWPFPSSRLNHEGDISRQRSLSPTYGCTGMRAHPSADVLRQDLSETETMKLIRI